MDQQPTAVKPRLIRLAIVVGLILAVTGLGVWLLAQSGRSDDAADDAASTAVAESPKLGVAVTVVDGQAVYQPAGAGWRELSTEATLDEGDQIRTGADSRVVLSLDDGSAVRLDADTMIELSSLVSDDVRLEQITGAVYSRVLPSDRQYTIAMDEITYQALGTAFVTVNQPGDSGVQVYQSSVKTNSSQEVIRQGEQYYRDHSDSKLKDRITKIDVDELIDDEFVRWNLSHDEKNATFKTKLGVLEKTKQQLEQRQAVEAELKRAAAAAEAAKQKADQQAKAEEKSKKAKPNKPKKYQKDRVKRGEMSLWQRGSHLGWGYTGKAIHGFKVVYSQRDSSPRLGGRDSQAVYVSNQYASSLKHYRNKLDLKPNKTYYLTVCAYTDGSESENCVDYSNVLTVKARR